MLRIQRHNLLYLRHIFARPQAINLLIFSPEFSKPREVPEFRARARPEVGAVQAVQPTNFELEAFTGSEKVEITARNAPGRDLSLPRSALLRQISPVLLCRAVAGRSSSLEFSRQSTEIVSALPINRCTG